MSRLRCELCGGSGACQRCGATGVIDAPTAYQRVMQAAICPNCVGYGTCERCLGLGYILQETDTMTSARKRRKGGDNNVK